MIVHPRAVHDNPAIVGWARATHGPNVEAMTAAINTDIVAVVETRVAHDTHRRATTLLADATRERGAVDQPTVDTFTAFVVAMLRHHHELEDHDLWPLLLSAAPTLGPSLSALSAEHARLEEVLAQVESGADHDHAVELRDLVHEHLGHEEPILFPALRQHLTADQWLEFSAKAIDTAPQVGIELLMALMHEVAPRDVRVVLDRLPSEARDAVPAMLAAADPVLGRLRAAGPATRERNAACLAEHLAAERRLDLDATLATLHPSCRFVDVPLGLHLDGRDGARAHYRLWWTAFGAVPQDGSVHWIDDHRLVAETAFVGNHVGDFAGIAPTGRPIHLPVVVFVAFEDGLLVSERFVYDLNELLRQLGEPCFEPEVRR